MVNRVGFAGRRHTPSQSQSQSTSRRSRRPALVLALALTTGGGGFVGTGLLLAVPASAAPSTLFVATASNGGSDTNDCSLASPCATISHAVSVAASGDTISVGAGTFVDSATIPSPLDLTITGAGTASTTLEDPAGDANQPVIAVSSGAGVTLSAVDVSGGSGVSSIENNGGDLEADGIIVGPTSVLENFSGTGTISNSTFSDDSSAKSDTQMTLTDDSFLDSSGYANESGTTTITGTTCTSGGLFQESGTMTASGLTVTNCQISGGGGTFGISASSFSGDGGGGIDGQGGDISLSTSTLTGTDVANDGGTTTIDSSTLSQDDVLAGSNGAGSIASGPVSTIVTNSTLSGTLVNAVAGTTSLSDSTLSDGAKIAASLAPAALFGTIVNGQCSGTITDNGYNLDFGDSGANSCGFAAGQHDVVEQDPQLGALQDNGGPTQTEAIASTSPAAGQIPVAQCPATDQRGVARPQPATASTCDIGSFEVAAAVSSPPTVTGVAPNNGSTAGGTGITITGTGFTAGATVEIGQGGGAGPSAIPATNVTVVSPTQITATTGGGAKAGTFGLYVITGGGTSAPNAGDNFTYHSTPPTVTGISPNNGPTSGGTGVTITGTGFTAGATVEIGQGGGAGPSAIPATNVTVVSPTQITATIGGGAKGGTFSLYVITAGGTSTGNAADNFTYRQPTPTVTGVSPNSGPTTGGTSITITGTGFITGATVEIGQGSGAGPTAIPATNVTVVSPTQITATTGGGAKSGTFSLFVLTSGGTSAGNAADNFTYH